MKDRLFKILSDSAVSANLRTFAKKFSHWFGKSPLGRTFTITESSIVAVAALCGETAVQMFFDGEDMTVGGKKVSEYFAECEKIDVFAQSMSSSSGEFKYPLAAPGVA